MRDLATVMTTDPTPAQIRFTVWLVAALVLIFAIRAATVVVLLAAKYRARKTPPADVPAETRIKEVA